MDARLLHQVWDVIETTQTDFLTQMDDPQLIQFLVAHLQDRNFLKPEDKANAKAYIYSRLLLIRELAQARQELCCPL